MPRPTATQPMPSQITLGWPERAAVTSAATRRSQGAGGDARHGDEVPLR